MWALQWPVPYLFSLTSPCCCCACCPFESPLYPTSGVRRNLEGLQSCPCCHLCLPAHLSATYIAVVLLGSTTCFSGKQGSCPLSALELCIVVVMGTCSKCEAALGPGLGPFARVVIVASLLESSGLATFLPCASSHDSLASAKAMLCLQ